MVSKMHDEDGEDLHQAFVRPGADVFDRPKDQAEPKRREKGSCQRGQQESVRAGQNTFA